MTSLIGHLLLVTSGLAALLQILVAWRPLGGTALAQRLAWVQFGAMLAAFVWLALAFVQLDWSLVLVVEDASVDTPWLFRLGSSWGQHEGSLLMWISVLSGYNLWLALTPGLAAAPDARDPRRRLANAVMAVLVLVFVIFTLAASSPFQASDAGLRGLAAELGGQGLTPILLDPALLLHPPLLYVGYIGLSASFALAFAGLMTNRVDRELGALLLRASLCAWVFLTAGLALGSWWAYYELGWGGWWAWDPVENLPFISWLLATALVHSSLVLAKRGALSGWTTLLALLGFSSSLFGTFFVRSGLLTSVHSFASDPDRGLILLAICAVVTLVALALYAWRAPQLSAGQSFGLFSREAALVLNNALLSAAAVAVLLGTLYPAFVELATDLRDGQFNGNGELRLVAAPYFIAALTPLALPLFLVMGAAPFLTWKRGWSRSIPRQTGSVALASAVGLGVAMLAWQRGVSPLAFVTLLLAFWIGLGALADWLERWAFSWRRLVGMPLMQHALLLGHVGMGVALVGMVTSSVWLVERNFLLSESEPRAEAVGYELRLIEQAEGVGEGFLAYRVQLELSDARGTVELMPSRRLYLAQAMPTTEAAIVRRGYSDIIVAIGTPRADGAVEVLFRVKPGVTLIWLGSFILVGGGFLGLGARLLGRREVYKEEKAR